MGLEGRQEKMEKKSMTFQEAWDQAIGPATENAEHAVTMSWYDEMVAAGRSKSLRLTTASVQCE